MPEARTEGRVTEMYVQVFCPLCGIEVGRVVRRYFMDKRAYGLAHDGCLKQLVLDDDPAKQQSEQPRHGAPPDGEDTRK